MDLQDNVFNEQRCTELVESLKEMLNCLYALRKDLLVQQHINEFYYMQKIQELQLLEEQLSESLCKVQLVKDRMKFVFDQAFTKLKADSKWLSSHSLKSM